LKRERKLELSKKLREQLGSATAVFAVSYSGLNVSDMEDVRNSIKESGGTFNVIKNSVVSKAVEDGELSSLKEYLKGPNAFALSFDEPADLAKLLIAKEKEHKKLEVKFGALGGQIIFREQIESLSKLPSKEVMLAQLLATMNAPVGGFVNVLAGNLRKVLYALKAIEEKKKEEN